MKEYNYIYIITNTLDDKIYIGQHSSNKLNDNYFGSGLHIKRAIKKYGKENFTKEILAYADTQEPLNWLEKYYIKKFKSQNPKIGYNIAFGGDGGYIPKTEDGKKRISEKHKGKHHTEEAKQKMRKPKTKYKWLTPTDEIVEMTTLNVKRWHLDWIKIK